MTARTWLTIREVADLLRVSKMTITRMVEDGRLPAIEIGGSRRVLRIPSAALAEYLAASWVGGQAPDGYRTDDLIGPGPDVQGEVVALHPPQEVP